MAILLQLLPLILRLISMLFAGGAAASHVMLDGKVSSSGDYPVFVGGYVGAASLSYVAAFGATKVAANWTGIITLITRILQLAMSDSEFRRRFKESFGFEMPSSGRELIRMARLHQGD